MKASEATQRVIGIDLGDRYSYLHELDMQTGETLGRMRLATNPETFSNHFAAIPRARITLEVGAHSPWSSRLLQGLGHQVIVANPRTLALIHSSTRKRDELDAEKLARLARLDPQLLSPIRHRSLQAHADRTRLKVREALCTLANEPHHPYPEYAQSLRHSVAQVRHDLLSQARARAPAGAVEACGYAVARKQVVARCDGDRGASVSSAIACVRRGAPSLGCRAPGSPWAWASRVFM